MAATSVTLMALECSSSTRVISCRDTSVQFISAAATTSSFSPKLRPKRITMISSSSSNSSSSDNTNNTPPGPILLVGVTGGTGRSVLGGLLAAGIHNSSLKVLTRNPQGSAAKWFEAQGVGVIAGDLDDADNVKNVVQGKVGVGVG